MKKYLQIALLVCGSFAAGIASMHFAGSTAGSNQTTIVTNGYKEITTSLSKNMGVWQLLRMYPLAQSRLQTTCLIKDGTVCAIEGTAPQRDTAAVTTFIGVHASGTYSINNGQYINTTELLPILRKLEMARTTQGYGIPSWTVVIEIDAPIASLQWLCRTLSSLSTIEIEFMSNTVYRELEKHGL